MPKIPWSVAERVLSVVCTCDVCSTVISVALVLNVFFFRLDIGSLDGERKRERKRECVCVVCV